MYIAEAKNVFHQFGGYGQDRGTDRTNGLVLISSSQRTKIKIIVIVA